MSEMVFDFAVQGVQIRNVDSAEVSIAYESPYHGVCMFRGFFDKCLIAYMIANPEEKI